MDNDFDDEENVWNTRDLLIESLLHESKEISELLEFPSKSFGSIFSELTINSEDIVNALNSVKIFYT
jgi:hypothetical protein